MRFESSRGTDVQYMYVCPGMTTASWEVTGVLVEGGVPFGERSEPTSFSGAPQAKKISA